MNQQIKSMQIIHGSLVIGTSLAIFFLGEPTIEALRATQLDTSSCCFFILAIIAIVAGLVLYTKRTSIIDTNESQQNKMIQIQTASIIRWAILEGAAFIIVIMAPHLTWISIALVLYLLSLFPTESKINRLLV